ncbi:DUF4176 domain-containing protein [Schaalia cardiffensis]|uniref:DUF4176 domain-containing protein n=1 Tax=Schaalia cardiffensis F0333 TaxID=888050 RepID=N6WF63_9ACTO|nr:DUF4176 domain-containing protein [Schaalia cardiffensis]ENO18894.1 hypothetical protein HMPREF9004_0229 [Schaalia cardiffensis F0333]MBJ2329806.1 DUF4176 domain-containing protein [Schaalia cardiffensis]
MSVSTLRPLLPLGSVVVLHNGDVKLMIIGRVPLYRDESIFGYFDYMAMRYPVGLTEDSVAYFNAEDIAEVLFEGFADEEDEAIQTAYTSALASGGIPYQRLNTADIRS